jgi:hypothetical protein
VIVIFVPAALTAAWLISRQAPAALDWFAVGTTALVVAAFLWYAQFFLHFPAFLAPFLGLSIGLAAARLAAALQRGDPQPGGGRPGLGAWVQPAVAALATAGVVVLAVIQGQHDQKVTPRVSPAALATVQRLVRPGACVLTDQVSFTIAADRFYSNVPGCSLMVDAIGTDYALAHGRDASSGAADYPGARAVWRNAFAHAQYVWLNERFNRRRVAWTPGLRSYFYGHFHRVYTDGKNDILYARRVSG